LSVPTPVDPDYRRRRRHRASRRRHALDARIFVDVFGLAGTHAGQTVTDALLFFETAMRGSGSHLVPWLQDFSLGRTYTAHDLRAQVDAARSLSTRGFLLWNPVGVYTSSALSRP
jgi:hypothetical protein